MFFYIKVSLREKYLPALSCTICKEGRETLEGILQCRRLPERKVRKTLKMDSLLNRYVAKQLKRWGKFPQFCFTMNEAFSN